MGSFLGHWLRERSSTALGGIRGRLSCAVEPAFRENFRFLTLATRPLLPGSSLPHQPHLTPLSPSLTCSCSAPRGPFIFLPTVLCTCYSICLKCFSLTLYLAHTFSSSSNVSSLGKPRAPFYLGPLFLCPWHLESSVLLPPLPLPLSLLILSSRLECTLFEDGDPVCCVQGQVPAPGTTPSTYVRLREHC